SAACNPSSFAFRKRGHLSRLICQHSVFLLKLGLRLLESRDLGVDFGNARIWFCRSLHLFSDVQVSDQRDSNYKTYRDAERNTYRRSQEPFPTKHVDARVPSRAIRQWLKRGNKLCPWEVRFRKLFRNYELRFAA